MLVRSITHCVTLLLSTPTALIKTKTYSEFVKKISYFRFMSKSLPLSLSFETKTEVFLKLNDFFPTYEYDTHKAYTYGYNRFCLLYKTLSN